MSIMELLATMSDDQWQILSQIQQFQALVALVDTPGASGDYFSVN